MNKNTKKYFNFKVSTIKKMKRNIPADAWKEMYQQIAGEDERLLFKIEEVERRVKKMISKYHSLPEQVKKREMQFIENFLLDRDGTLDDFHAVIVGCIPFVSRLAFNSKRRNGFNSSVEAEDLRQEGLAYLLLNSTMKNWIEACKKKYIPYCVYNRFAIGKLMKRYCFKNKAVSPILESDFIPEAERLVTFEGKNYSLEDFQEKLERLSPAGQEVIARMIAGKKLFKWQAVYKIEINRVFHPVTFSIPAVKDTCPYILIKKSK